MNRREKIKALAAFAKGDVVPFKELIDSEMKPLFVTAVEDNGTYYLNFDDLVLQKEEFDNYINGKQPVFAEIQPFGNADFPNKHLPKYLRHKS
ncbi:hypothetical protein ABDK00_006750 [Niabella insulamsoli]|uniref:hypothetical protein n=1 Tax=Niabella insulamsoli TaxID=3144874 RepID=UPI0031FD88A8